MYQLVSEPSTISLNCKRGAWMVMLPLQCSSRSSQRESAKPAHMGAAAEECGGMLGPTAGYGT